jgi:hypothetical protein
MQRGAAISVGSSITLAIQTLRCMPFVSIHSFLELPSLQREKSTLAMKFVGTTPMLEQRQRWWTRLSLSHHLPMT